MNKKLYYFSVTILVLISFALLYELYRDTFFKLGDFKGYILAGNCVLNGEYIYSKPLINTWPPFFSIFSVPLAIIDNFSGYLVRFLWLSGLIVAMVAIIKITLKLSLGLELRIFPIKKEEIITPQTISIIHPIVIVPLIISLRYILENMSNIQINVYMLLMALSSLYFYEKKKNVLASLILAFSISLKIYTVFLLLYFLIRKEYKITMYTILFTLLFSAFPILIFGYGQTLDYYSFWYRTNVEPFASINHKNQSYFSFFRRLFIHESPGLNGPLKKEIYINILNLEIKQIKVISYGILAVAGAYILYIFREKLSKIRGLKAFLEYAFILNAIPLLSPLAWKAYFIFLYPSYFMNYLFIFKATNQIPGRTHFLLKVLFYISLILTVFSSEIFVGSYFSDVMEVFSAITVGSILLLINLILIYLNFDKFQITLKQS